MGARVQSLLLQNFQSLGANQGYQFPDGFMGLVTNLEAYKIKTLSSIFKFQSFYVSERRITQQYGYMTCQSQ